MDGPYESYRSNETAARLIAWWGPCVFWGTLSVLFGGVLLLG